MGETIKKISWDKIYGGEKYISKPKIKRKPKTKGSFETIMGWPQNLRLGGHFIAKCENGLFSQFRTMREEKTFENSLSNFYEKFHTYAKMLKLQQSLKFR